jgi:hypothetical protein
MKQISWRQAKHMAKHLAWQQSWHHAWQECWQLGVTSSAGVWFARWQASDEAFRVESGEAQKP